MLQDNVVTTEVDDSERVEVWVDTATKRSPSGSGRRLFCDGSRGSSWKRWAVDVLTGKLYATVIRLDHAACPVRSVPAAEIEGAVVARCGICWKRQT